ncbi:MAG TPA: C-terminal binding protein [Virgibacillus sp.]|nr:C-terminal binding protein [Virgibacillus sp.]
MKVVITDVYDMQFEEEKKLFESVGATLEISHCVTEQDVIKAGRGAVALINSEIPITHNIISSLPDLKVIAKYSIGVDNIDVDAATEHGVYVANVPDYCQEDVANHTLALIMALTQKIISLNQIVKQGKWSFKDGAPLHRIHTQTVGLISFGRIAQQLAQKLLSIGFKVIAHDPYCSRTDMDVDLVSLEELMRQSDVISVHTPLVKETYHMIDKNVLAMAKPTAILVNAGRGAVINEEDLIHALREGIIAGAGLDVLEEEPINDHNPLLKMDNVILTPHIGFYSEESMQELQHKTALNVVDVLQGNKPRYHVNHVEKA